MSKIFKLKEVIKIANEQPYKYAEITNSSGNFAMPGSGIKMKPVQWLTKKVEPALKSWPYPGIYYLNFYTDQQKRSTPHVYPIQVGEITTDQINNNGNSQVHIHNPPVHLQQPNVLSYKEVLELQQRLAKAEAENTFLKAGGKTDESNEEEEEEEEEQTLGEKVQNTFSTIIENALPVLNNFMQDRRNRTQLEWAKFVDQKPHFAEYSPYKMPVPGTQPPKSTNDGEHPLVAKCDEYLETQIKPNNPDLYNEIQRLTENMGSFEDFCAEMNKKFPKEYAEMYQYCQSK